MRLDFLIFALFNTINCLASPVSKAAITSDTPSTNSKKPDAAELKEIVLEEDPHAFMAIENLHEVVYGKYSHMPFKKKIRSKVVSKLEID